MKTARLPVAIFLVLSLLGSAAAFGQEGGAPAAEPAAEQVPSGQDPFAEGQDPFDVSAFDQTVEQGTAQEKKAALEVLFGGNLLFDSSVTTTSDFDGYAAGGSFSGKGFVKVSVPDYGAAYVAYNVAKNIFQGTGGSASSFALGDLGSAAWELSEFYLSFDVAQAVFFRVGSQLLAWGPSLIWTPVDFVNLERVDPLSTFDLRSGQGRVFGQPFPWASATCSCSQTLPALSPRQARAGRWLSTT